MKIPERIKIGGHWLDIQTRSDRKDDFEGMGVGHHWDNMITLQEQMAQSKKESVLIHEAIHEIDKQNGLNLNETQVSSLGEGIYAFLIDNWFLK